MRFVAVAVIGLYLLPSLLPGAVALVHDAYHVVQVSAGHQHPGEHDGDDASIHEHGAEPHTHVHAGGDAPHSHAPLVDALLIASEREDEIGPTRTLVEIVLGPGLHLPGVFSFPSPPPSESKLSGAFPDSAHGSPAIDPAVPPPKV